MTAVITTPRLGSEERREKKRGGRKTADDRQGEGSKVKCCPADEAGAKVAASAPFPALGQRRASVLKGNPPGNEL